MGAMRNGADLGAGGITGIDELLGGNPVSVNEMSMSLKIQTGCDDDPEFPIVAAFVRTGAAIDETLDIEALRRVYTATRQ